MRFTLPNFIFHNVARGNKIPRLYTRRENKRKKLKLDNSSDYYSILMRISSSSSLYIIPFLIIIMMFGTEKVSSFITRRAVSKKFIQKSFWRRFWSVNEDVSRSPFPIQRLHDQLFSISLSEAHEVAKDPLKSTSLSINDCMKDMQDIDLKDIGLTPAILDKIDDNICMSVCVNECYHMAVFIIPKGKSLPLHDHPGMMVMSSIISGKLHVREFTVTSEDDHISDIKSLNAKLSSDCVKETRDSWYLSACENNIHEFTALENTAVFDVLLPPYEEPQRPCTYYKIYKNVGRKSSRSNKEKLNIGEDIILKEIDEPEGQLPYGVKYVGYKPKTTKE